MNGEVFIHWAKEPFELIRNKTVRRVAMHREARKERLIKPPGFWFDVDGDWKRWCEAETFRLEHLGVPHEVIVDESRCQRLSSAFDLDLFTEMYTMGPMIQPDPLDNSKTWAMNDSHMYLDWSRIQKEYAGLIIAPYIWERRMEYMWYYGWDCASGVVWDIDAVISCKPNMNLKELLPVSERET